MNENYRLKITECRFENLDVNHSFDVIRVYKNTFADEINISKSSFNGISGHVLALDKETDDIGIYNAERVTFTENHFSDIEIERNSTNDMSDADETEAAFDLILNETGGNDPAQFKGNFFFDTFILFTIRSSKMYL